MATQTFLATKNLRIKLDCRCGTSLEVPVDHLTKVFNGDKNCPTCGNNWDFQGEDINPYHALTVVVDHLHKLDGVDCFVRGARSRLTHLRGPGERRPKPGDRRAERFFAGRVLIHWHEAIQRFAIAKHIELQRLKLAEVGAAEDVRDILLGDRFPDVQANQHVAGTDALVVGRTSLSNIRDPHCRRGSGF